MKIYIANLGIQNHLWPTCLERSTIALFEDVRLRPFWERRDREGYIAVAKTLGTVAQTAGRWFNLPEIILGTAGDIWIHRDGDYLWWTVSKAEPATTTLEPWNDPTGKTSEIYITHKPVEPWSNRDRKGNRILWKEIHPTARWFLTTEATVQSVATHADYALALINGDSLAQWHSQPLWEAARQKSGKGQVTNYDPIAKSAWQMAYTAMQTTKSANGQDVTRTLKNKDMMFASQLELEEHIKDLAKQQQNLCAITSLQLQFMGVETDPEMLCSLDRIESSGHYERGNLQLVCRFINRWKSDSDNDEFRRLIKVLQTSGLT
ncbi:hypothetical protein WT58_21080 [Burkholderia territorii]|uniref:hypothetical protein n=1 Tax=Burkholderia territorii TaxID=1503055 RepID=UPI0007596664|nr:hypothetical protein [Burkholderia territorii]KWH04734.1 hypothetical protein WT58_21080 [Burkholderia territorii]